MAFSDPRVARFSRVADKVPVSGRGRRNRAASVLATLSRRVGCVGEMRVREAKPGSRAELGVQRAAPPRCSLHDEHETRRELTTLSPVLKTSGT